jgi:hypothetical protein
MIMDVSKALCMLNIPGEMDNIGHNICVMQQSLSQILSESQSLWYMIVLIF